MKLHEQVADLKRQLKSAKMKITKLETKNGNALELATKEADKALDDLRSQLTASQEHVDVLQQQHDELHIERGRLRTQIGAYQRLVQATAEVTTWRENVTLGQ